MTDVRNDNTTLIHSIDDVLPLYAGNGLAADQQTIGMETEISLYRRNADGSLSGANAKECADLVADLKSKGYPAQLEMASALEYASAPYRATDLATMSRDIRADYAVFRDHITAAGLSAGSAQLPFATLNTARGNLVDRDRARGLVEGMQRFKPQEFLKVTLLCTSTQVSASYSDADDLYRTLCTGYALSPVIFALFANHPAFIEGGVDTRNQHPRAAWYGAFGDVGGVPASLLQARDGDDFIKRHAAQVFNNDMLFYYDQQGEIVWPEKPLPFAELAKIGLNTRSNYDLSESFLYHDLKVCNIRDENGIATGKRVEFRGFDSGALSTLTAHAFIGLLLRDERASAELQGLLMTYGMTPDCDDFATNLIASRAAVAQHGGKYLDVAYGNGTLRDFCADLADVLNRACTRNPDACPQMAQLIALAQRGTSLAELSAAQTPDYKAEIAKLAVVADQAGLRAANDAQRTLPRPNKSAP